MRVVIATDGSLEADISRAILRRLPLPRKTKMTVAMVTHLPVMVGVSLAPDLLGIADRTMADTWRIQRRIAQQTVDRVAEDVKTGGYEAEGVVLEGDTADELLDLITKKDADAVVAGCGVSSNLAAFFLGSVSRKLVLYSEASVLIGRHYADRPSEDSYKSIARKAKLDLLVAVDGSKGGALAIESLERLSKPAYDNVWIVAVEPLLYPFAGADPAMYVPATGTGGTNVDQIAHEAADRIRSCGNAVEVVTALGRPSSEISRIAREKCVDLIMLGANRHGALERFLIGSCAYETATGAPCSVLICRDVLPFADEV